jgi:hypothetical protein
VVESSIDILVPTVNERIGTWYSATRAAIDGMPPHITLLWPWLDAPVSDEAIVRVRRAVSGVRRVALALGGVGRFPGVVYLEPEPRSYVDDLVARLVTAFPETPPYGGVFGSSPVPHLTVATSADERVLDVIERRLRTLFEGPLRLVVDRVSISEQGRGSGGHWAVRAEVPFGQ